MMQNALSLNTSQGVHEYCQEAFLLRHHQSSLPFRQPLLEPWALLLRPVALAVAADGHVLAARGKTVMADRGLFCLRFTGLLDAGYFRHVSLKNTF